jgi:hypothetical protein
MTCEGCCGSTYQAQALCTEGIWGCPPAGPCENCEVLDSAAAVDACTLCDAGPDSAGNDAPADGGGVAFLTVFNFGADDDCLPIALSSNGSTGTTCRVLLTGVVDGCQQSGLSAAGSGDVMRIDAKYLAMDASPPPASMLCEATQLPAAATAGAGCANQAASGWCYVQGSCPVDAGQHCQQDICTTPAYGSQHVVYAIAWLACP